MAGLDKPRLGPITHYILKLAKNACGALGLIFLIVTVTPVTRWWAAAMAGPFSSPSADAAVLIVLGGSELTDGTMGGSSYWRAVYGVRAWRLGHYQRVLVCGGSSQGPPIAVAIRDYMVSQGVPAESIIIETRSRSTRENALFAAPLLVDFTGKKVLLTSDYHIYRSKLAFSRAGILTIPFPFPDVYKMSLDWKGRWPGFLELCNEVLKIGYYKARAWI